LVIKSLPNRFKIHGYDFRQVHRVGRGMVYLGLNKKGDLNIEIHLIRQKKLTPTSLYDKPLIDLGYTHREIRPGDRDWGLYGWTHKTLIEANNKLDQLKSKGRL
jgi:hypothetical protein